MQKESSKITVGGIIFYMETAGIDLLTRYMAYPEVMAEKSTHENHLAEAFLRMLEKNREIITSRDLIKILNNCRKRLQHIHRKKEIVCDSGGI